MKARQAKLQAQKDAAHQRNLRDLAHMTAIKAEAVAVKNNPETWGIANDTLDLPSGQLVDNVKGARQRVQRAKRMDPFDALYRNGGLTTGEYEAARRLFRDWCVSHGIMTEDPRIPSDPDELMLIKVDEKRGPSDRINQKMIDAGRRYVLVLHMVAGPHRIGQPQADLLKALITPQVMCGSVLMWRPVVELLTKRKDKTAQSVVVGEACSALMRAYEALDELRAAEMGNFGEIDPATGIVVIGGLDRLDFSGG